MVRATVLIARPIVAKIIRGVSLKTSRQTNSDRLIEKSIIIPPGKYPVSIFSEGARVLHIQSQSTLEKFRAFVDDFDTLVNTDRIKIIETERV